VAFFVVPAAVGYVVLGDFVVAALLQSGRFGPEDTRLVWYVLGAFSLGLVATTASRVLQSCFYAVGEVATPAKVAAVRVAVTAVVGVVVMLQLDRVAITGPGLAGLDLVGDLPAWSPLPAELRSAGGPLRLGAMGLALAASVGAWVELALLRRRLPVPAAKVRLGGGHLGRTLAAGAAAAGAALAARPLAGGLAPLAALAVAALPPALAYLATATALGVPEATSLVRGAVVRLRRQR
jgi:putative peptidoglycan lipid II flippase